MKNMTRREFLKNGISGIVLAAGVIALPERIMASDELNKVHGSLAGFGDYSGPKERLHNDDFRYREDVLDAIRTLDDQSRASQVDEAVLRYVQDKGDGLFVGLSALYFKSTDGDSAWKGRIDSRAMNGQTAWNTDDKSSLKSMDFVRTLKQVYFNAGLPTNTVLDLMLNCDEALEIMDHDAYKDMGRKLNDAMKSSEKTPISNVMAYNLIEKAYGGSYCGRSLERRIQMTSADGKRDGPELHPMETSNFYLELAYTPEVVARSTIADPTTNYLFTPREARQ